MHENKPETPRGDTTQKVAVTQAADADARARKPLRSLRIRTGVRAGDDGTVPKLDGSSKDGA